MHLKQLYFTNYVKYLVALLNESPKCNRPKKRGGGGVYSPMEDLYIVTYINIPETKINRKGNSV